MSAAQILKSMKNAPRLEKETYNRWSTHFLDVLCLLNIEKHILEILGALSEKPAANESLAVRKQDQNIRVAISQLVPDTVFHLVGSTFTAKECWDNLRQFYCPNQSETIDDLLQKYWGFDVDDDVDVDDFVQQLSDIRSKINIIDNKFMPTESSMKTRIISHFMTCCSGFFMSLVVPMRDQTVSFNSVVSSIRASQSVYRQLHPSPTIALVNQSRERDSTLNLAHKDKKKCAYCSKTNHVRDNCFLWLDTPEGSRWAAKNPEKAARTRALQKRLNDRNNKKRKNNNKSKDAFRAMEKKPIDESDPSGLWIVEDHTMLSRDNMKNGDIILDTGATNHVFHEKTMFSSIFPMDRTIITASGESVPVSGVGRVQFKIFDYQTGMKSKVITMEDVWYVPSCTRNLVSGFQLLSKGFDIRSSNGGLSVISEDGSTVATARPRGGLFCFNTSSVAKYHEPSKAMISHDTKRSITEILHQRFAHLSCRLLQNVDISDFHPPIIRSKDTSDFRMDNKVLKKCDVCNSCKQVERINREPVPRSCRPLEIIHSDTWGKCRVPGIFHSLYFVSFTDDYSRESEVFLLKSKSHVPLCFKSYKDKKECQSGHTIKALRFDGGSEFKKIEFGGIVKQITAPYTQHQNGVSERLNRSLITMVRCMLVHAHLPLRFWDAALQTACYLRNRLPNSPEKITPFELMTGSPLCISHLKVWGCVCYSLIDDKDPQRFKLSATSHKGIFIGYCESSTQYRVYIPSKPGPNKVIISANVRFLEDCFWDWRDNSPISNQFLDKSVFENLDPASDDSCSGDESETIISVNQPASPPLPALNTPEPEPFDTAVSVNPPASSQPIASELPEPEPSIIHQEMPNLPDVRRSNRVRKPIEPRSAWQPRPNTLQISDDVPIPQSYSKAFSGPNSTQWRIAINEELKSLKEKGVFTPIKHVPSDRKPIGSRWVFATKSDGRFKARLVAQGFSQIYGVDYFETYSPTLRMDTLRILLAVAAFRDWEIHQVDVKTAYLEGDLEEEIYMRSPEGLVGTEFVRVDKALYGLKQSGRAWYKKLDEKLGIIGFERSKCDACVYIHPSQQLIIGVYVDDLIICGKVIDQVLNVKKELMSYFPIKDLGNVDLIIGWKIFRERATRTLKISQSGYLIDKIRSLGLLDAKVVSSPINGYDGILPGRDDESPADESAYASVIGSLGFASISTRPDISFVTSQLGRYNSSPVTRHWNTACKVLRYLNGTKNYSINYSFGPISSSLTQELKTTLYSDSDFAADITDRRSVSGYILMLGGGPICWQSRRQKSVSTSTAEAEYVALFEASKIAVWVNRLLGEFRVAKELSDADGILTFTDNQSALAIACGANSPRTKHIDVSYHFVRECILEKKIILKYIPTNMMLADVLTKPLPYTKAKPTYQKIFGIN